MSDNLKEMQAAFEEWAGYSAEFNPSAWKAWQAAIASQQAAHEAEIARLRAQVAMLLPFVKILRSNIGGALWTLEDEELDLAKSCEDAISNTQATADQFIAECEQRGAVKALEEAADRHWYSVMEKCKRDGTNPANHNEMFYGIALLRNSASELRATSKKAG